MEFLAGFDGGATKTTCLITDVQGAPLGMGVAGGANYHSVGLEKMRLSIEQSLGRALRKTDLKDVRFKAACFGLAGVDRKKDFELVCKELKKVVRASDLIVVNDALIALLGATAGNSGVLINAGTGAIAYGMNKEGNFSRSSGWGYLLGDEGGGFDVARRAMIACLRAYDGRGKETSLISRLCSYFNLDSVEELVGLVYKDRLDIKEIAGFTPLVCMTAREGDEVSKEILYNASEELSFAAIAIVRSLHLEDEQFDLVITGGLFKDQVITENFKRCISKELPKARIALPRLKPEVGAIIYALQKICVSVNEELIASLSNGYGGYLTNQCFDA